MANEIIPDAGSIVRKPIIERPTGSIVPDVGSVVKRSPIVTAETTTDQSGEKPFFKSFGDLGMSALSGITEGGAGLADVVGGVRKQNTPDRVFVDPQTGKLSVKIGTSEPLNLVHDYAQKAIPNTLNYKPESTSGEITKRVSSFLPGAATAALTGGATIPEAFMYGAAVPAGAGMVAEPAGTALATAAGVENPEAYGKGARIAAEMLSPMAAGQLGRIRAPMLSSAQDRMADLAKVQEFGVPVTAAPFHAPGGPRATALSREMGNPVTAAIHSGQDMAFTRGVLKNVGIDDTTATKYGYKGGLNSDNISTVLNKEVDELGSHIGSIYESKIPPIPPNVAYSQKLGEIRSNFGFEEPKYTFAFGKDIHEVRKGLNDIITGNSDAPGATLPGKAEEARVAIKELDDMVSGLTNPDVINDLKLSNDLYSRMKISQNSFEDGLITPPAMVSAIEKSTGKPEELQEIASLAKNYLSLKGITPTKENLLQAIHWIHGGMVGGVLGSALSTALMGFGVKPAAYSAAAAVASGALKKAYDVGRASNLASDISQGISKNKALYGPVPSSVYAAPAVTSLLNAREGRKSGGRVTSHDEAADQLVRDAERAKKGWSEETEPLLNQTDEAVAHALEVANRSI